MGKPYSDLEKQALAIIRGGGNPATSADEGLANYWKWRLNPADSSHDLPAASTRADGRKLDRVAISPFAALPVATQKAKVTISQRSLAAVPTAVRTAAALALASEEPTALVLGKFKPARAYFRLGAATTPTERTSRITKRKYKTAYAPADQGYSFPFGKKAATDTLASTQADIRTAFGTGATAPRLITFSPEVFRA
jgi:hypothetical protein